MKIEQLVEGISPIVFHQTTFENLQSIMYSGEFHMKKAWGADIMPGFEQYPYFMSTSRTRMNAFTRGITMGSGGWNNVFIILDGRKMQQNMKGTQVNYWQDPALSETEDRVMSKKETFVIDPYILRIDIFLGGRKLSEDDHHDFSRAPYPVYVYENRQDWMIGNIRKAEEIHED